MTGYGRATVDVARGASSIRVAVEMRSVNHRGFDVKIRTDEPDAYCDVEIARVVHAAVERGAVTVAIRDERPSVGLLDVERIRETRAALERLRAEAGLTAPVDLATVAAFLASAAGARALPRGEDLWQVLSAPVAAALAELVKTREREGAALRQDLLARSAHLAEVVGQIEGGVGVLPGRFAKRLEDRLAAVRDLPGFEPGRIAQEVAILAERLDVTEELVRLRTHLAHFRGLLDAASTVGRKLDFVIQEIGRELNTVGSKAQDAGIAAAVIEGKAELEKIREQAQNIE